MNFNIYFNAPTVQLDTKERKWQFWVEAPEHRSLWYDLITSQRLPARAAAGLSADIDDDWELIAIGADEQSSERVMLQQIQGWLTRKQQIRERASQSAPLDLSEYNIAALEVDVLLRPRHRCCSCRTGVELQAALAIKYVCPQTCIMLLLALALINACDSSSQIVPTPGLCLVLSQAH